eukprot:CAMPEP_0174383174 /NCGR_PEP_ID=MMETSP0811_2-20130205/125055_1 /TAXON_ID=73025 ORGANISM="Eutreptiella gymnastica-like, Strain CCMP1594" /NCGR_SAMPLE_ID=MMETSP0811_2 /ASSEMBLY_ACC=CAM_ASM_000667 /LENGTH=48 /DNA_ID= /DNA_START= /DNA_END= /DNA_ORIENTATION=
MSHKGVQIVQLVGGLAVVPLIARIQGTEGGGRPQGSGIGPTWAPYMET